MFIFDKNQLKITGIRLKTVEMAKKWPLRAVKNWGVPEYSGGQKYPVYRSI